LARTHYLDGCWQKLTSDDPRLGFFAAAGDLAKKLSAGVLSPDKAAVARNDLQPAPRCVADDVLPGDGVVRHSRMARVSIRYLRGLPVCGSSEAPYQVSSDDMMKAQLMRLGIFGAGCARPRR